MLFRKPFLVLQYVQFVCLSHTIKALRKKELQNSELKLNNAQQYKGVTQQAMPLAQCWLQNTSASHQP